MLQEDFSEEKIHEKLVACVHKKDEEAEEWLAQLENMAEM
jgi:hypothetical protein